MLENFVFLTCGRVESSCLGLLLFLLQVLTVHSQNIRIHTLIEIKRTQVFYSTFLLIFPFTVNLRRRSKNIKKKKNTKIRKYQINFSSKSS